MRFYIISTCVQYQVEESKDLHLSHSLNRAQLAPVTRSYMVHTSGLIAIYLFSRDVY